MPLEFGLGDGKVRSEASDILAVDVHVPLLFTATDAPGLALEAHYRVYLKSEALRDGEDGASRIVRA
jgi:hypothetical protein